MAALTGSAGLLSGWLACLASVSFWAYLGAFWGALGASGAIWAPSGRLLGAFWAVLGCSGRFRGDRSAPGCVLGASGAAWALLGRSWRFWGDLGASGAIWARLGRFGRFCAGCWCGQGHRAFRARCARAGRRSPESTPPLPPTNSQNAQPTPKLKGEGLHMPRRAIRRCRSLKGRRSD